MGGSHSFDCNQLAKDIWKCCVPRNLWLTAFHLPVSLNVEADKASQIFHDQTEWKLKKNLYTRVTEKFYMPTIDSFHGNLIQRQQQLTLLQ